MISKAVDVRFGDECIFKGPCLDKTLRMQPNFCKKSFLPTDGECNYISYSQNVFH